MGFAPLLLGVLVAIGLTLLLKETGRAVQPISSVE
jgi:ascorbate-specific PTS system EIIC-type component UlaA